MNIACTGSVAYDYLMTFPGYFREQLIVERLELVSLSFLVDSMVRQPGGTAANIAYTLALFGAKPHLVATVGEDFGPYRSLLESKGIDTTDTKVITGEYTASFFANTDLANAQIASFYPGAMSHAAEISIMALKNGRPDLVIISPNDPAAMIQYAKECQQNQIPYLYDPSQQVVRCCGDELREGLNGARFLFVNDYEFDLMQKKTGLTSDNILNQVQYLIVTNGEKGADVFADGRHFNIPVVPAKRIIDPTGVGDAFRGGFLTGYRLNFDWEICGKMGALAATYCLEEKGTLNHHYTPEEFVNRFRQHFDDGGLLDELLKK